MILRKWQVVFALLFLLLISCQSSQPKLSPLPPGSVILAFGDSLTFGTGATPETSYPFYLEMITGFKVVNAGIPGEETQEGLQRISGELEKSKPKLVILCLGANDIIRRRPYESIKANLRAIIEIIQKSGAQVVLIGVPSFSLYLTAPDFYQELGSEMNIPVDTQTIPSLEKKPEYKSDYVHFNKQGYQALAGAIADLLKRSGAY